MDVDNAAYFLASTILFAVGVIILCLALILLNNIFSKFWKPVKLTMLEPIFNHEGRFVQESKVEPNLEVKNSANIKGELK
jgi:hypothetical protein